MKKFLATMVVVAVMFSCKLSVNAADLKDIFSAQYYADTYEDLYAAFEYDEAKLLKHVKEYGIKENRDISPILDVAYYRETYPDLDAAFGDDWDAYVNHYFEYGIKEGRDNGTSFDIIRYVNSYADLREAFGEDYEALANHYIEYGMKENRTMALKPYVPPVVASAPAAVTPTVVEVHTYDEAGRIEMTEVYSDSSKTTLLYTVGYYYGDDGSKAIIWTDAQDNPIKGEEYDANGALVYRIVIDSIEEDDTMSGTAYGYSEGKLIYEEKVVRDVVVKETYYYMNGTVEAIYEYDQMTGRPVKETEYYENGVLAYQWGYDANGMTFEKEWDQNGTLRYHHGWDEENGFFEKEWDENGNLLTEGRGQ